MTKRNKYYAERYRNGTKDQIDIMSPQGKAIAYIQFWDEPDTDDAARAEANAMLIVNALNAYQPNVAKKRT